MVKLLKCGIVESEFHLQSVCYVLFSTITFGQGYFPSLGYIIQLLVFYNDYVGIKYPTKVAKPLFKETRTKNINNYDITKYHNIDLQ